MRTSSTLVGLTLLALATPVRAEEAAPAPAPAGEATPSAAPADSPAIASQADSPKPARRKWQVGASFLPMGLGKYIYRPDSQSALVKSDAYFAYGGAISIGYEVLPHLLVAFAPQAIYNVQEKTPAVWTEAVNEYDLMARVAYMFPVVENIDVYAEVLPGYSLIRNTAGSAGLVLAFGAGFAMNLTDRYFINVGGGYQMGFQKWANGATSLESQTRYVRGSLGGGVKF